MKPPTEIEIEAKSLFDSGDIQGAIQKYSLASKMYKDGKDEVKANQNRFASKLLSAIMKASDAVTEVEFENSISDFEEARKVITKFAGKEKEGYEELVHGLISLAKASIENIHGRSQQGAMIFEDAAKTFGQLEDKLPELGGFAETQRLGASFAANSTRALRASGKDNATYHMNRAAALRDIESLKGRGQSTEFLEVQVQFIDSTVPLYQGMALLSSDPREARRYLVEAEKKMSESLRFWEHLTKKGKKRILLGHSNDIVTRGYKGINETAKGLVSFIDGEILLYLGDTVGARKGLDKALKTLRSSSENVASLGDYSKILLEGIQVYESRCIYHLNSMSKVSSGVRRRIGLSAGKQFGLLFVISLISFLSLSRMELIDLSDNSILLFSLVVSGLSAFGLNAIKLFNVLSSSVKM